MPWRNLTGTSRSSFRFAFGKAEVGALEPDRLYGKDERNYSRDLIRHNPKWKLDDFEYQRVERNEYQHFPVMDLGEGAYVEMEEGGIIEIG